MVKKVTQALKKPKSLAFLGFLILSFIIWLMITLADIYTSVIRLDLTYNNVPKEKLMLGDPDRFVDASVNASGYRLLNYKLFRKDLSLDVASFSSRRQRYFLSRKELETQLKDQYGGIEVRRVFKDTLWLALGENKFKKVKVVPDLSVNFQEDHEYSEPLKVVPDSIEIKGPEDVVMAIDSLVTEKVMMKGVKEDFNRRVRVLIPDSIRKIELEQSAVILTGTVARFSEKILEVPLVVENIPEGVTIKTFPRNIRLLCKASISDLKRMVPSGFRVVCDYNDISANQAYLLPKVVEKPSFVREVTLLDNKVEYLINRS
ncbi:CdaR family protein [Robertkochia flava]|uniref:CdaR family protein n=1 Tax=Robertkochia flava TaxID=3447986 RepID=UPI001CCDEC3A|nr:YbbR-like domain-containing protein [Robertkochia marina]